MNKYVRLDIEGFKQELESYKKIVTKNQEALNSKPGPEKQIFFWMESTRFLLSELEIWNELGENAKCAETIVRIQQALGRLHKMIQQLE